MDNKNLNVSYCNFQLKDNENFFENLIKIKILQKHRFPAPPMIPPPPMPNSWMNDDDFPRFDQQPPSSKPIQQQLPQQRQQQQQNLEDPAKRKPLPPPPLMSLKVDKSPASGDKNEPVLPKILEGELID